MNIDKKEQVLVAVIVILILVSGIVIILWENFINRHPENEINSGTNFIQNQEDKKTDFEVKEEIIIHIDGEVKKPGVYRLNEKSRIIDAVKAAGGETSKADLTGINLADFLSDGSKIIIPGEKAEPTNDNITGENMAKTSFSEKNDKININQADLNRLTELNGIGDSIAQNIIDYRGKVNGFDSPEQLKEVSGIGDKIFANLEEEITL